MKCPFGCPQRTRTVDSSEHHWTYQLNKTTKCTCIRVVSWLCKKTYCCTTVPLLLFVALQRRWEKETKTKRKTHCSFLSFRTLQESKPWHPANNRSSSWTRPTARQTVVWKGKHTHTHTHEWRRQKGRPQRDIASPCDMRDRFVCDREQAEGTSRGRTKCGGCLSTTTVQ